MNQLLKPVMTEKSMRLVKNGVFTFLVNPSATKNQVKESVQQAFKVHVVSATSAKTKGGTRRLGKRRLVVADQPHKVVRLELKPGENISLFDIKDEK